MKRIKMIGVLVIFILACIFHFGYTIFPNFISSILFPVNESIWEHMKLFVTPVYLFSLIEYFIYNKEKIKYNNFLISYGISIILSITGYLVVYLVINYFIGHNAIIAILLLFIFFVILEFISYKIMNYNEFDINKVWGISLIVGLFIIMGILTYFPINSFIFYDFQKKIFGIK